MKYKNKVGGFTIPDFKTYYKNYSNQDIVMLASGRQIDQLTRIESPEIDIQLDGQLIFIKVSK